jgi:hypothetical protein
MRKTEPERAVFRQCWASLSRDRAFLSSPILVGRSPGLLRLVRSIEKDLSHVLIWKNNLYRYAVLLQVAAHDVVP